MSAFRLRRLSARHLQDSTHLLNAPLGAVLGDENEPGNSGIGEKSLSLVEATFSWARDANPVQPLTIGVWTDIGSDMSKRIMELSDIVSFHDYTASEMLANKIGTLQAFGRPVICTEFLLRQSGNTFEAILPMFSKHRIGWYHWGLVAGRT